MTRSADKRREGVVLVGLYKIFFHLFVCVQESAIRSFPPPTCIGHTVATLMHDDWAVYEPPPDLRCVCLTPYNIGDGNIV